MSDDQDQEQKTEEATGKKLAEARDSGQLPISREVGNWFLFAGVLIVIGILVPVLADNMMGNLRILVEMPHQIRVGDQSLQRILTDILASVGIPLLLIFAVLLVVSIAGTMAQTGFFATSKPLEFSWDKLSPTKGLKNMFSKSALVELLKSFIKICVIGYIAWQLLFPYVAGLDLMIGRDLNDLGPALQEEAFSLLLNLMTVISLIAVVDLLYRRYDYYKSLRMTKQEVKDEMRQSEGDPMIKLRIRQLRMEKARKRMMSAVPKADVVLTNPTHYAVALKYEAGKMSAPVVVAKGADIVARHMRELATKHNVPLVANPPLARALFDTVEVDEAISPEHYRAVAEVISYVFRMKGKKM